MEAALERTDASTDTVVSGLRTVSEGMVTIGVGVAENSEYVTSIIRDAQLRCSAFFVLAERLVCSVGFLIFREEMLDMAIEQVHEPFRVQIYRGIRLSKNQFFWNKFGFTCCDETKSTRAVGVFWNSQSLSLLHNARLPALPFMLSAFQEWTVAIAQATAASGEALSLMERYNLVKNTETRSSCALIFPFSLFNHLLCMLRHRKATNLIMPIHVHEYALGKS